jgi:hypothetical protein
VNCQHTVSLGVYLLGAVDPTERFDFEAHLATCETCRRELVRLAPLPGLLNQITLCDFEDERPSTAVEPIVEPVDPTVIPTVIPLPAVQHEPMPEPPPIEPPVPADTPGPSRRRFRQLVAAAAVVVLLTIGGIFGWQAMRNPSTPDQAAGVTWSATSAEGVSGDAQLIDHEWGTEIQVKMRELPPGEKCYLVVFDHYGRYEIAGWWGTNHDIDQAIPTSTSIDRSQIERLEFRLDAETTVLTIEPPTR